MTKYRAFSFASGTIINAIAAGKGSAFAINLKAEAEVGLNVDSEKINVSSDSGEDTSLAELCIRKTLDRADLKCGADAVIKSEIPVAQGLSSSSAVSNAVVLATAAACKLNLEDMELINIGVDCSIEAGVSITGALDDASASYFGGITVTDNLERKILKRENFPPGYKILILVSEKKFYTGKLDKDKLKPIAGDVDKAFTKALDGEYFSALTSNGVLYSKALGYDSEIAYEMLEEGAVAAGLSGTGPAFIGVVEEILADKVREVLEKHGRVIETTPVNSRAKATPAPP